MELHLNKVSKSYKNNKALQNFTAVFEPGIYALLGPNGSGKSTLMNIITDNLKADLGEILYKDGDNEPENALKMGVRFREKIGFMPQYPGLYPNFTVERFMCYMAALKDIEKTSVEKQIPEILKSVELDDVLKRKISALSGGMKQRLSLAQAVLGDPEILILDEPTAGLDPKQRIAIRNYISRIAFNKIVIIATHVVSDIEYIAHDIIMLKKGVIIDHAPPNELINKIKGKVFAVQCDEADVADIQQKYRVTNIIKTDSGAELRILSEIAPFDNARCVNPTLEDYYLYIFGEEISPLK